jgi:hypothetical protein
MTNIATPEQMKITAANPMNCPLGHGQMFLLESRPTLMNPEGREFPTWWCPDCGTQGTRGVSGNSITVTFAPMEKGNGVPLCQQ